MVHAHSLIPKKRPENATQRKAEKHVSPCRRPSKGKDPLLHLLSGHAHALVQPITHGVDIGIHLLHRVAVPHLHNLLPADRAVGTSNADTRKSSLSCGGSLVICKRDLKTWVQFDLHTTDDPKLVRYQARGNTKPFQATCQ